MSNDLKDNEDNGPFGSRIRYGEQVVHLYYDAKFENQFKDHDKLVNKLTSFVEKQNEYSGQDIRFHASHRDDL